MTPELKAARQKIKREYINTVNAPTQEDADDSARRASLAASAARKYAEQTPSADAENAAGAAEVLAKRARFYAANPSERATLAAEWRADAYSAWLLTTYAPDPLRPATPPAGIIDPNADKPAP